MVTVGMNYMILAGKEQAFETVFYKVLAVMEEMEGHTHSHLFREVRNPQHYLIVSEWTSQDAFEAFIGSPRFKSVVDWGREQVLSGRPSHQIYGAGRPPASPGCPVAH